jgi:hypothetical protein
LVVAQPYEPRLSSFQSRPRIERAGSRCSVLHESSPLSTSAPIVVALPPHRYRLLSTRHLSLPHVSGGLGTLLVVPHAANWRSRADVSTRLPPAERTARTHSTGSCWTTQANGLSRRVRRQVGFRAGRDGVPRCPLAHWRVRRFPVSLASAVRRQPGKQWPRPRNFRVGLMRRGFWCQHLGTPRKSPEVRLTLFRVWSSVFGGSGVCRRFKKGPWRATVRSVNTRNKRPSERVSRRL